MKSIIFIGPMRAGKTTVSTLLANRLNLPDIHLDKIKHALYAEMDGYDADHAVALRAEGGLEKMLPYVKPFEAALVESILQQYPEDHVIDFGAGHSVFEEANLFERVKTALIGFPYVIYLMPTPDIEEAVRLLNQRDLDVGESGLPEMNRLFVTHPSNAILATHTFYNQHQTPEQTCDDIFRVIWS
jgi:shikimate kinase